jgi:hypothetical protein
MSFMVEDEVGTPMQRLCLGSSGAARMAARWTIGGSMSSESLRKRLDAIDPDPLEVEEPMSTETGRRWHRVVVRGVAKDRFGGEQLTETIAEVRDREEADLFAHAPTDLALALDVIEAAHYLSMQVDGGFPTTGTTGAILLRRAIDAFEASP